MTYIATDHGESPSRVSPLLGARSGDDFVVRAATAAALGWLPLALVDQIVIAGLHVWTRPAYRVLEHHLYELGLALAAGVIAATFVWAFGVVRGAALSKLEPRRSMLVDALALSLLIFEICLLTMRPDLDSFAGRKAGAWHQSARTIRIGFEVAMALAFAAAMLLGRLLARPRRRWIGVGIAAGIAVVNSRVLFNDYWTLHSAAAGISAVLAGASLVGARVPHGLRLPSRIERALVGLAALLAAWAAVVPPAPGLAFRVLQTRTTPFTPLLTMRGYHGKRNAAVIPPEQADWFAPRNKHPPIPSTRPADAPDAPIVVMLSIDAFRGDVLESRAHDDVLPELVELRDRGVHFENAISPSTQTVYTMSSWFSGKFFSQLFWSRTKKPQFWPDRDPTKRFPALLQAEGIESTYVMAAQWLNAASGLVGGFSRYDDLMKHKKTKDYAKASMMASDVVRRLKEIATGQPYFIYAHFMDAHVPYKGVSNEGEPFDVYVRELAVVDHQLGVVRRAISDLGLEDRTTLIVTADHGEAFGEHGTYHHGGSVYQELAHVPLLFVGPGYRARTIKTMVSTLDIGPTILDTFGVETPGSMMGQSLVSVLHGAEPELTRPIVSENRLRQTMFFPDGIKVSRDLRLGSGEAYDLSSDPLETKNRVDDPSLDTKNRFALLDAFFDAHTLRKKGYKPPFRR